MSSPRPAPAPKTRPRPQSQTATMLHRCRRVPAASMVHRCRQARGTRRIQISQFGLIACDGAITPNTMLRQCGGDARGPGEAAAESGDRQCRFAPVCRRRCARQRCADQPGQEAPLAPSRTALARAVRRVRSGQPAGSSGPRGSSGRRGPPSSRRGRADSSGRWSLSRRARRTYRGPVAGERDTDGEIPDGEIHLRDGRVVTLRVAAAADEPRIAALYAGLSPESFRRRFHSGRRSRP